MSVPTEMNAITVAAPGGPDMLQLVERCRAGPQARRSADPRCRRGRQRPRSGPAPRRLSAAARRLAAARPRSFGRDRRRGGRLAGRRPGGGAHAMAAATPNMSPSPPGRCCRCPQGWTLAEAAALPECWFTVTQTLVMRAGLEAAMSVLVTRRGRRHRRRGHPDQQASSGPTRSRSSRRTKRPPTPSASAPAPRSGTTRKTSSPGCAS